MKLFTGGIKWLAPSLLSNNAGPMSPEVRNWESGSHDAQARSFHVSDECLPHA